MLRALVLGSLIVLPVLFLAEATEIGRGALTLALPWLFLGAILIPVILGICRLLLREDIPPSPEADPASGLEEAVFYIGDDGGAVVPAGPICLICQGALDEVAVYCTRCRTPHHKECFRYAGTCSVFGCGCRTYRLALPSDVPWAAGGEVELFR